MKKNYHIFIDGPDGCSKTTVSKGLHKKTGFPIIKMKKAKNFFNKKSIEDASYVFNTTIAQLPLEYSYIIDRGFVSSLIYSKIYKRKENLDYINKLEKIIKPKVVILTANNEELFKRRKTDKVISNEMRKKIKNEYDKMAKKRKYYLIDTTGKTRKRILIEVLKILDLYE